ncbi:MAG: phospho-N-acetylmuramoyl-pentapeptide-transferase, partial [Caldisericaceae bacterium]
MSRQTLIILFIVSFLVSFVFLKLYIPFLRKRHFVQFVRDEGVKVHKAKEGTPRGGGLVFLLAPLFLIPFYHSSQFFFLIFALFTFGAIGAIDDLKSITNKESMGLSIRSKLILYTLSSVALFFIGRNNLSFSVEIASLKIQLGGILYFLLFIAIMLGSANAFNLTDGVDGLLGSVSLPIFLTVMLITSGVIRDFSLMLISTILVFLWFNSPKASVFMGDSGASALGG